jgi:hypothetical protein
MQTIRIYKNGHFLAEQAGSNVPSLNLGRGTNQPNIYLHGFPQLLQENAGLVPKIRPQPLASLLTVH